MKKSPKSKKSSTTSYKLLEKNAKSASHIADKTHDKSLKTYKHDKRYAMNRIWPNDSELSKKKGRKI